MPTDLNIKHKDFTEAEPLRKKSRELCAGPHVVWDAKEEYLFKTPHESDDSYEYRHKRAVYDNWPSLVVESRQSMLWRNSPKREIPDQLQEIEKDIDLGGSDSNEFFKELSSKAEKEGLVWVLADMPPAEKDDNGNLKTITKAEELEAGKRPYLTVLPADSIPCWSYDSANKLRWVVIAQDTTEYEEPGEEPVEVKERLVWYRDRWERYAEGEDGWKVIDEGENPLGRVPVVPFYGVFKRHGYGEPTTKDILPHTIAVYNKYSDRDIAESLTNNPIPWMTGPENPGKVSIGQGTAIFLKTSSAMGQNVNAGLGYLEPTGAGLEASRLSERELIRRIHEIALHQAKRDTGQVQSAESLKMEGQIFASSLASVATTRENSERKCWMLLAAWKGMDFNEDWVEYNKEFDEKAIEAAMLSTLSDMQQKGQISLSTLHDIMKDGVVLPEGFSSEKELALIQEDQARIGNLPE